MNMKKFFCFFVVFMFHSFLMGKVAYANESLEVKEGCPQNPLSITDVDEDKLLKAYFYLKKSIQLCGTATAYVRGSGGSIHSAQAFFDLMRTDKEVYENTTFITSGIIWSASNYVWLSAKHRIVTPSHVFIVHGAKWNMNDEDPETRVLVQEEVLESARRIVTLVAGEEASKLWMEALTNKRDGFPINAQEAIRLNWATEIREYAQ
jgi:ATP-dependent protease ClpP protease subunit